MQADNRRDEIDFSQLCVTRNWYVGAWSNELSDRPLGRVICGRRVVFFRDRAGQAQATAATCPHRGADLANGRVTEDSIECPFHGIAFDGSGRCTRVPSQDPAAPIPRQLRIAKYPVIESGGLIWVWPQPNDAPTEAPVVPSFLQLPAPWRLQQYGGVLCAGSYLNTLENALDDSHLAFVHGRTIPGAPARVANYRFEIDADQRGYGGVADLADPTANSPTEIASGGGWADLLARLAMENVAAVRKGVRYRLSGLACYTSEDASGPRDYTFAFFTPAEPERTWMFGGVVRNHSLNPLADRLFARYMPALAGEDSGALAALAPEARGPGGLERPFVVRADRQSFPFRRLYGAALVAEGKTVPWALHGTDASGDV